MHATTHSKNSGSETTTKNSADINLCHGIPLHIFIAAGALHLWKTVTNQIHMQIEQQLIHCIEWWRWMQSVGNAKENNIARDNYYPVSWALSMQHAVNRDDRLRNESLHMLWCQSDKLCSLCSFNPIFSHSHRMNHWKWHEIHWMDRFSCDVIFFLPLSISLWMMIQHDCDNI